MLRAIIVDDEAPSIKRLRSLLAEHSEIEVCETFLNPLEAVEFIKSNPVDVAFLDISMPEIKGIELSGLLHEVDASIDVIFITGHDEYAVQAFDVSALDYLLKPVTSERLAKTLGKIMKKHDPRDSMTPSVSIHLFNGLKIYADERQRETLKLRSPKTEELLAFLIYKQNVSREEIIETLWSELEPDKAWKNLNTTLYYIRKAMSDHSMIPLIQAGRNDVTILTNRIYCDFYEFDQLVKQIRRSSNTDINLLLKGISLYTGRFLEGKAYEWALNMTRELEITYLKLLEMAARFYLDGGERLRALHYFEEMVNRDALREDIHYEVIRLYMEIGRKNEARSQYQLLEKTLQKELGMFPDQRFDELTDKNGL